MKKYASPMVGRKEWFAIKAWFHIKISEILKTIKVKNQRGSIGFVPTPLLQELRTEWIIMPPDF